MTMTMTSSKGANRQPGYLDAKRVGKDDENDLGYQYKDRLHCKSGTRRQKVANSEGR